ncbi:MAG: TonB-dependent receptor [Acidobacteriia bacterium]|nr:TonB-dependent receptor [Terriglobia bacterium]
MKRGVASFVLRAAVLGGVFLLTIGSPLRAQFTSGVEGTVIDATDAVVPEVALQLTNVDTGVSLATITNGAGRFRFIQVPPGRYTLKASKVGFRPALQENIVLESGRIKEVPLKLELGAVSQDVAVQADVAPVETTDPKISTVVTNEYVNNIPIAQRNIYNVIGLAPGITGYTNQLNSDAFQTINGTRASANGARMNTNGYYVDGSSVNDMADGGGAKLTPNPDSVQEVQVTTNDYSAQWGKNSGILTQVVTKTGTNQVHGSLYWYHRDNELAARTYLQNTINPVTGRIFPAYRRNEGGFSLGGPIRKDKTFVFGTFDKLDSSNAVSNLVTVETPELVSWMQQNYPNNVSTKVVSQFKPAVPVFTSHQTVAQLSPGCAGTTSLGVPCSMNATGTGVFSTASIHNGTQFNIRADQLFRDGKDRLYGNVFRTHIDNFTPGVRDFNGNGGFSAHDNGYQNYYALNETHTFSPSMFNDAAFSVYRTQDGGYGNNYQIPNISVNGITGFGAGWAPAVFIIKDWNWSDIVSMNRGRHFFKAGIQWADDQETLQFTGPLERPNFNFSGSTGLFDFIQDNPFTESGINFDPRTGSTKINNDRDFRFAYWSAFAQDDWKVKSNLTLNYGVRWEYNTNPTDKTNQMTNVLFGDGPDMYTRLQNMSIGLVPALLNGTGKTYFAPRFGLAWDPSKTGKLSIRAGFGVFYETFTTKTTFDREQLNPPLFSAITAQRGTSLLPIFAIAPNNQSPFNFPLPGIAAGLNPRGGPIKGLAAIAGTDPNVTYPYALNWFTGVQYAITPSWVLEVNYLASRGVHLYTHYTDKNRCDGCGVNRPNPFFSSFEYIDNSAFSMYQGGTLQVRHRFSKGLAMQAAYTIGKALDEEGSTSVGEGGTQGAIIDAWNLRRQYGLSENDIPQRLAASFVYNIPSPKLSNRILNRVVGGWEFSGILTLQKGEPQTVTNSNYDFNNDLTFYDVPDAPLTHFGGWSRGNYVNGTTLTASAFPLPPGGAGNWLREGNLGRNTYRGPGFAQQDLAFAKNNALPWAFKETANLQLRFEMYNAFNRVNATGWVTNMASGAFGRTTGSFIPRTLQLTARLTF